MADVIQRLKASRLKGDSKSKQLGYEAGQFWASNRAEAHELERVDQFLAGTSTTLKAILQGESGAFSPGEILYFAISPENDGDRSYATDFWDGYADNENVALDGSFVLGFAEGAVAIWEQVKSEL